MRSTTDSVSWTRTLSVISSTRQLGSRPDSSSALDTSSIRLGCWKCLGRDVHAQPEGGGGLVLELPLVCLPAGGREDPAAQRDDEAGLLGQGDEVGGKEDPAVGMAPADQGLEADAPGSLQAQDGLVVHLELAGRPRPAADLRSARGVPPQPSAATVW